jgi:hypothetical protein
LLQVSARKSKPSRGLKQALAVTTAFLERGITPRRSSRHKCSERRIERDPRLVLARAATSILRHVAERQMRKIWWVPYELNREQEKLVPGVGVEPT